MAGKTRGQKAKFFEARRNDVSVPAGATNNISTSFVNIDRTIINLILPYFNLEQLIHAERVNRQFRKSIINFYRSMETFHCWIRQRTLRNWLINGLVDKICNYFPNVTCLQVHSLCYLSPSSQLSLLTRLTIIRFHGSCTEFEFKVFVETLKTIANQLLVLDLFQLNFKCGYDDIPDQHLLSDFLMLQELRLSMNMSKFLPNIVMPNLQILKYFDCHKLLHPFCQKNVQIEELLIFWSPFQGNMLIPCVSFAVLHNLRVLYMDNYWINDNLAKHMVGCCSKLTDLTLRRSKIESDVMQIIYKGLFKTLVKLELWSISIQSINAIRGIHKLENLECLMLHIDENISFIDDGDGLSIGEILSLKSLHVLHIDNIPITFGTSAEGKFQSLDELKILNDEKTNRIKILDFCTDRLKSFEIGGLMPNERWIQLGNDFPNLHTLCIVYGDPPAEETLQHLSRKLINLKYLDTSYSCWEIASLVPFIQNSKRLTTIITSFPVDKLEKHPDVKRAQKSGRYIDIRSFTMNKFDFKKL